MNYQPLEVTSHLLTMDYVEDPLRELTSRLFKVTLSGDDESGADILGEFTGNLDLFQNSNEGYQAVLYALASILRKRAEICADVLSVMHYDKKKPPKKNLLNAAQRKALMDWYTSHPVHPYPSKSEKEQLSKVTGLSLKQIDNWFINTRRRRPTH
jgi:hypothetical protein